MYKKKLNLLFSLQKKTKYIHARIAKKTDNLQRVYILMHSYNSHIDIKDPVSRIKAIEEDIAEYKRARTMRQVQELMNIHDSGGDGVSHAQRTGMENTIEDRTLQHMLDDVIRQIQTP